MRDTSAQRCSTLGPPFFHSALHSAGLHRHAPPLPLAQALDPAPPQPRCPVHGLPHHRIRGVHVRGLAEGLVVVSAGGMCPPPRNPCQASTAQHPAPTLLPPLSAPDAGATTPLSPQSWATPSWPGSCQGVWVGGVEDAVCGTAELMRLLACGAHLGAGKASMPTRHHPLSLPAVAWEALQCSPSTTNACPSPRSWPPWRHVSEGLICPAWTCIGLGGGREYPMTDLGCPARAGPGPEPCASPPRAMSPPAGTSINLAVVHQQLGAEVGSCGWGRDSVVSRFRRGRALALSTPASSSLVCCHAPLPGKLPGGLDC